VIIEDFKTAGEIYQTGLYGSLQSDPEKTRGVDYVAGMGFANELGRQIHRLKAHDPSAWGESIRLLTKRLEAHNKRLRLVPVSVLPKLAAFVIRAHIAPNCPSCGGRGIRAVERGDATDLRRIDEDCRRCHGTGILNARAKDFEWGRTPLNKGEQIFNIAVGIVERCEAYAERTLKIRVLWQRPTKEELSIAEQTACIVVKATV